MYPWAVTFLGAGWLERPERVQEERTDLLLSLLALQPGDTVADIGAGTGYFSLPMSRMVGPEGRVLAVDIPSGIAANTGAVLGCAVEADRTVTISLPKIGLALEPGASHAGEVRVARVGIADPDPTPDPDPDPRAERVPTGEDRAAGR